MSNKQGTWATALVMAITGMTRDEAKARVGEAFKECDLDPTAPMGGGGGAPVAAAGTSGVPRDMAKLKGFVGQGEWNVLPRGRKPEKYRKDGSGNPTKPGYCQGSKTGSCGDAFPDHDYPYAYRKSDQPGGPATICVGCFQAAGGVEKPYTPKGESAPPVTVDDETGKAETTEPMPFESENGDF